MKPHLTSLIKVLYNIMDDDETDDFVSENEVGVIAQLAELQSEVQMFLAESRDAIDKSMEDGIIANLGYDDDSVVAIVLAHKEIRNPGGDIMAMDLLWAGAFLDHLDTLGYQVIRKDG